MDIKPTIEWSDFEKIDMRTGTVVSVEPFNQARKPAWKLIIDFGELGLKKSSAQIKDLYHAEELQGKQIIAVVNFPPKQIATFFSECLIMGVYTEKGVVLLGSDMQVKNGAKVG